jgi:hypothetical protein
VNAAIIAALRAHAAGRYPEEAGTELLTGHGGILHRDDFAGFVHTGTSISDGTTPTLHNQNLKLLITAIRHAAGQHSQR